jgi:hypothetical protein
MAMLVWVLLVRRWVLRRIVMKRPETSKARFVFIFSVSYSTDAVLSLNLALEIFAELCCVALYFRRFDLRRVCYSFRLFGFRLTHQRAHVL